MARNGITRTDVFDAATELAGAGTVVTVKTIREYLGDRGSYSTISRYLREWEAAHGRELTQDLRPPASVERDALRFLQSLWRALFGALQRNSSQQDVMVRQLKQIDTALDHSKNSIRTVEQQCTTCAQRLGELTDELTNKERELQRLEQELAASERRLEALQEQETRLEKRVALLSERQKSK